MPFRLTTGPDFLRIEINGTFTRGEFVAFMAQVEAIEQQSARIPDRLISDLSLTSGDVGPIELLDVAARRKAQTFRNSFKTALVATTPAGLGIARMFQTLNDHPQVQIEIFDTEQRAALWLRGEARA
jgi:hypothetical protein